MSYQFQSSLYNTKNQMVKAIAETWITANGMNSEEEVKEILANQRSLELAFKAIADWGLRDHMNQYGYTSEELAEAIENLK